MKRKLAILLVAVMCAGLFLAGCNNSGGADPQTTATDTTSGTTSDTVSDTVSDTAETFELKFSSFVMDFEDTGKVAQYWIDQVEEKTNGRVKITPYWGGTFASHGEHPSLVASGALELAMFAPNIFVSEMPLNALVTYNISEGYSREQMIEAAEALMFDNAETAKILQAEEQRLNIKFLAPMLMGCEGCISARPFNSLADMQGWKVTSEGGMDSVWTNLDLSPVYVDVPDLYESFSRNVVDTVHLLTVPITQLMLTETGKYYREWDSYYMLGLPITVNLDIWNSLPADIQEIFIQASKDAAAYSVGLSEQSIDAAWSEMKDAGVDVGYFSPDDTAAFIKYAKEATVDNVWTDFTRTLGCEADGKILLENWVYLLTD